MTGTILLACAFGGPGAAGQTHPVSATGIGAADAGAGVPGAGGPDLGPEGPTALHLLWLSDSIYNLDELGDAVAANLPGTPVTSEWATFGGTVVGTGLLELADSTDAYLDGAWQDRPRGTPFSSYSALVFEFLRNDANEGEPPPAFQRAYDKVAAQGTKYFPAVVSGSAPPAARPDLSGWDVTDPARTLPYRSATEAVAARWNTGHVDTYGRFLELVSSGQLTVNQLMADVAHPSRQVGVSRIGSWIAAALQSSGPFLHAEPDLPGMVANHLFGQPTGGTWALTPVATPYRPYHTSLQRIATLEDQAQVSTSAGSRVVFPSAQVAQVWAHFVVDQASGGTVQVYVDAGSPDQRMMTVETRRPGVTQYPTSVLVADDLAAGLHTVEMRTLDAEPVRVLGVTYVLQPLAR